MMCKKRQLTREEYSAVLKSESRGVLTAQSGGGSDGQGAFSCDRPALQEKRRAAHCIK